MLKSIFAKQPVDDQYDQALVIANVNLMNRVIQVIETASRSQEKHSTLTSLRPLSN
jgi:hypothetical protein